MIADDQPVCQQCFGRGWFPNCTSDDDGYPIEQWEEYCSCPIGVRKLEENS